MSSLAYKFDSFRRLAILLSACLAFVPILGCWNATGGGPTPPTDNRPMLVCTTGQVGDMLEHLVGGHYRVVTLMGPGVDPHLYRPTPADMRLLNQAKIIFYNGLHLEGKLVEVLEKLAEQKPTFAITAGLVEHSSERLRKPPHFSGYYDPHVWFDVGMWAECVAYAAEKLSAADPTHAADYRQNAATYVTELKALDEECRQRLAEIPPDRRILVTAHDAFGYFGRAYGIEVHGMQGISTADEADLGTVNELVKLIVDRKVKAVFVESSVSPKKIASLREGCAAQGHELQLGAVLYSDALGAPDTPEATYVGTVRWNVNKVVEALK